MLIRIHECHWIPGGCQVTFSPNTAVETFKTACERAGWILGGPHHVHEEPAMSVLVVGPSEEEFRAALEKDPRFAFCSCFAVPAYLP
jgi:hypothetical protein